MELRVAAHVVTPRPTWHLSCSSEIITVNIYVLYMYLVSVIANTQNYQLSFGAALVCLGLTSYGALISVLIPTPLKVRMEWLGSGK